MRFRKSIFLIVFLLTGCIGVETDDAKEAYNYWAGQKPPRNIIVLKGQYWQSSHWSKEYILYLKLKCTSKWSDDFIKKNRLQLDTAEWIKPKNLPEWFAPTNKSTVYSKGNDSRYFIDTMTGFFYIYEIQL